MENVKRSSHFDPTVPRGWKFSGQRRDALRGWEGEWAGRPLFHLSSFSAPTKPPSSSWSSMKHVRTNIVFSPIPAIQKFPSDEGQMAEHAGQLERRSSGWDVSKLLLFQPPSRVASVARQLFLSFCCRAEVKKERAFSVSELFQSRISSSQRSPPPVRTRPSFCCSVTCVYGGLRARQHFFGVVAPTMYIGSSKEKFELLSTLCWCSLVSSCGSLYGTEGLGGEIDQPRSW